MLRRIWELHRTIILVGLFGLGVGTWLSSDAGQFKGIVLGKDGDALIIYQASGAVISTGIIEGLEPGDIVQKLRGERCCTEAGGNTDVDDASRAALKERYALYWSQWSGSVDGFIMREHPDDADTAVIKQDDGTSLQWKVWEADLAGLKRGERLCKRAQAWSPIRCNPEAGIVEFKAPAP